MKKLLAIVISMAMIVAMMPMGVFAAAHDTKDDNCVASIVSADTTTKYYDTLQEAVAAAQSGETVELLNNLTDTGRINLPAGVILDGKDKKLSGDSSVSVNAAGGTVKNVIFEKIHNEVAVDKANCEKYGWESKRGNLSAIYSNKMTGNITVENCTFDNVDWDAVQIIDPQSSATVIIRNNVFKHTGIETSQLRYIHIEIDTWAFSGQRINGLTITDNQFYKSKNSYEICAVGIWRVSKSTPEIKLDGNYFEDRTAVELDKIDEAKLYPMRSNAAIDIDDISPLARVGNNYYDTLGEAVASGDSSTIYLLKDCNEDVTIDSGKSLKLYTQTYKLGGNITNDGTLNIYSGTNKEGTAKIVNNGTLTFKCDAATGYSVTNNGLLYITSGVVYDFDKINNNGTVSISGGTFATEPDKSLLVEWYSAKKQDDNTFKVSMMKKDEATENGAVATSSTTTSVGSDYSKSVTEAINKNKAAVHLLCDVNEDVVNTGEDKATSKTLYTNGYLFTGSIKMASNVPLRIYGKEKAVLTNIESSNLTLGRYDTASNVCIKEGSLNLLDVMASAKCLIEGGTFKEVVLHSYYKKDDEAAAPLYTSELKIVGGTFSFNKIRIKYANHKLENGDDFEVVSLADYVAEGYKLIDNANGTYTVKSASSTGGGAAVVPPATDKVTNNSTEKKTTADLAPAVKDNKAETTVDAKTADKIVDKAVENKSTEVIVDATGNNTVASSEVAIPEKTVKELAEKTDANLVIKTDNGKVDLDRTALEAVAAQAGTDGTVKLIVETVKTDENICHVELKLITSNGAVKDFRGGNVKVTINLDKELAAKELVCVYIDDNGSYTLVEGVLNADGTYTFTTGHFSEYAVMAKAEADKKIAEQLNTLIKEVNLKVRTSKTSKKNIKAVVSGDVKALTDAGYTVKYKFYRSEKKASKYTAAKVKDTNTYINTAGKKGTKYYYKAKALVYDGDKLAGQTELKQCRYGVRTWSK